MIKFKIRLLNIHKLIKVGFIQKLVYHIITINNMQKLFTGKKSQFKLILKIIIFIIVMQYHYNNLIDLNNASKIIKIVLK